MAFGFPTKVSQDAPEAGRLCPRCHNGMSAPQFTLEIIAGTPAYAIQQWQMKQGTGPDPQPPGVYGGFHNPPPPPNRPPPNHSSYHRICHF
ncbi:hypothetical protein M231_03443 [Tremella mesenterica]|uniref:Uncharacterized protein n=1 Tax=Tremella mesenterica TaxID=5217 RepID=A0A4Q1BMZ9_TREME|nr:hypothetical protein M231_03443 [Tremella mesenterica]